MKNKEITRIFQSVCKQYAGGITAIAALMDTSATILANKLNPNYEGNHLSLTDACEIIQITQDRKLVLAFAWLINETLVPLPEVEMSSRDVLVQFVEVVTACGGVGNQIKEASSDGSELGENFSTREKARIRADIDKLIVLSVTLKKLME